MEISKRVAAAAVVVCIVIGVGMGLKIGKTVPQIETVTKDRVVTVVRQIKSPNGTIITDVRQTEDRQQRVAVAPPAKPDWTVQALYGIAPEPYYGVGVYRRVLGDLSAGVQVNTRGEVMVGLLYQF